MSDIDGNIHLGSRSQAELNALAERAWQEANDDALSAVKFLRDWTGLSLADSFELVRAAGRRLGKPNSLRMVRGRSATDHIERDPVQLDLFDIPPRH